MKAAPWLLAALTVALAACSTVAERKVEYKNAKPMPSLEVPPDLLSTEVQDELASATAPLSGSVTLSEYNRGQRAQPQAAPAPVATGPAVGPQLQESVRIGRDGAARWLIMAGEPSVWWPKLKEFVQAEGLAVIREDMKLGVLETDWSENRGAITEQSFFRKSFDFLYSSSTRDKYVIRVEPGTTSGTSEIFVTHRGMQQVAYQESVQWLPRASEAELEVEMLQRIALFAGAKEDVAQQVALEAAEPKEIAQLRHDAGGEPWLNVQLDFARTWARVANGLSRVDVTVEDFDRNKGLFYVAGVLPKEEEKDPSWLKRFFRGYVEEKPEEFKIKLEAQGEETRVTVLNKDGTPNNSKRAELLLEKIKQQLR